MLGGKNVSLVPDGELLALIKSKLQRRVVRLQQHIRHNDFVFQLRMLARMPRILMRADVPPGPAIESPFLYVGDVVGDEVVP